MEKEKCNHIYGATSEDGELSTIQYVYNEKKKKYESKKYEDYPGQYVNLFTYCPKCGARIDWNKIEKNEKGA